MDTRYTPPKSELTNTFNIEQDAPFFVTSIFKMCLLYVATMGAYGLYWGYKQWSSQSAILGKTIWPSWRAFFLIFYIHSLGSLIARRMASHQLPAWRYGVAPTSFVLSNLAYWMVIMTGQVQTPRGSIGLSLACSAVLLLPLIAMQIRANLVSQDKDGSANRTLSLGNICWIILGLFLWLNFLAGS